MKYVKIEIINIKKKKTLSSLYLSIYILTVLHFFSSSSSLFLIFVDSSVLHTSRRSQLTRGILLLLSVFPLFLIQFLFVCLKIKTQESSISFNLIFFFFCLFTLSLLHCTVCTAQLFDGMEHCTVQLFYTLFKGFLILPGCPLGPFTFFCHEIWYWHVFCLKA